MRPGELTPEERALALAALAKARPKQYQVVDLHLRGLSQDEIAKELGMGQSNVSQRLRAGLRSLAGFKGKLTARRTGARYNS